MTRRLGPQTGSRLPTKPSSFWLRFWSRFGYGLSHGCQYTSITNDRTGLISMVSTRLIDSDSQTPVLRCVLVGEPIYSQSWHNILSSVPKIH